MLSKKHKEIAEETIPVFTSFGQYTVESINEGSCEEFAEFLNEEYARASLNVHRTYCTLDFLPPNGSYPACESLKEWQEKMLCHRLVYHPAIFKNIENR